jgi:DNA-binding transcriptional MerR regulator/catechol 2,3-dioxygenase-like lactoylglutathione lyase family enzyme
VDASPPSTALLSIGQFAALTSLSPKALRIYQEQGLLAPAHVDESSGYRYYAPSQLPVAARIAILRRARIGLADIAAFLAAPDAALVDRWRADLAREVEERRSLLDHIAVLTTHPEPKEHPTMSPTTTTSISSEPVLQRAAPVLASLDLDATQRFYAEKLGFTAVSTYPDYAISTRDDIELHFWLTDDADIPKQTSCYVRVTGVDALHDEMQAAGVVHPNGPLRDQPWGLREFAILDEDGNLIKFGERVT